MRIHFDEGVEQHDWLWMWIRGVGYTISYESNHQYPIWSHSRVPSPICIFINLQIHFQPKRSFQLSVVSARVLLVYNFTERYSLLESVLANAIFNFLLFIISGVDSKLCSPKVDLISISVEYQ